MGGPPGGFGGPGAGMGGPPGGFGGPGGGFRRRGESGGGGGGNDPASALSQTIRMEGEKIVLQFPNNPVMDMLSIYELLTGVTLIKDTNILEGAPVSLATPRAVEKAEAVKLIEATLLTNGYAIIMEPDGKSARILPARNQSANAVQFSHGVQFYTSPQDLPQGETIVSYFMKLDNLDPEEAATMLSGHVGLSVYGRITPVLTPPGLLITESSTVVKQLISIRETLDVGDTGSSLVTKFIPVIYAEASTISQIIQATLTAQAQEKETKGVNTIRGNTASDGRSNKEERREEKREENNNGSSNKPMIINGQLVSQNSQSPEPTAQVVADTRLNQILVVASPADYAYIASLIAEFDKPLTVDVPYERKMKYAAAVDVLSAVVDLLQDTSGGTTQLPGGGSLQQQRSQALSSSSSQLLGGRSTTGTRGGQVLSTSGASDTASATSTTGGASRADVIQGPSEDNAPVSVLVNKTRVIADPMANAILVVGRKEEIEKVNNLLDKLDRKPSQVYLATVIGQLTLGDGFQFGIDYLSALSNKQGTNFSGSSFNSRTDFLNGDAASNTAGTNQVRGIRDLRNNVITSAFGPTSGMNLYGAIGDSLEVFVTALETTNRFKVLSRPSVFALNNKKATITSGSQIPVPVQSTVVNTGNNPNVTTNIEYRDVVLKLEVVPLINADGEVTLTIAQVNDTVIGTQLVEPNLIPIIGTEQIITTVNVPDRNTIVLGGLISEQEKKDTKGMPFLSRIPGVGNLFKDNNNSTTRKELIIFIQPHVVTDNESLRTLSYREDLQTKVGADVVERFPEEVNAQGVRLSDAEEQRRAEALKKKGNFFSRMFSREGKVQKAAPPPGLKR
jgi:general secretion pathway protein D